MTGHGDSILEDTIAAGTPEQGNFCKIKGCGGTVVKQFIEMFRGTKKYDQPKCNRCEEKYPFARFVQKVGG